MSTSTVLVAYPGPPGSHTAAAAAHVFPAAELHPLPSFRAVAEGVTAGAFDYGLLAIESSLAGAVAETHDLLYEHQLAIVGETVRPIVHQLAGPAAVPLDEVRVIRSHPAAFEQCRRIVGDRATIPAATTADAARIVAQRGDVAEAALASPEAVELYGLTVLADDVGDHHAFTRFVTIASHTRIDAVDARIALSFVTDHRPAALHAAITPIAEAGLDLQRLVSRPLPETPFQYRFDAVVAGNPLDPRVRDVLRAVRAVTRELRVLGVYEAHDEEEL
ncbi:MAG: prephenate dehydratase domain-containing protein [Actinomycetota bacterium]